MVTMYCKHAAYISSYGSHVLTAWFLMYWTCKVNKFGYGQAKLMVPMSSKYTAHISSNGSHFLMA